VRGAELLRGAAEWLDSEVTGRHLISGFTPATDCQPDVHVQAELPETGSSRRPVQPDCKRHLDQTARGVWTQTTARSEGAQL
jgi:hypothetical protein